MLRRTLSRRVQKRARARGEDPEAFAETWIAATVARAVSAGLVDDARFTDTRLATLRRRGTSTGASRPSSPQKGSPATWSRASMQAERDAMPDGEAEAIEVQAAHGLCQAAPAWAASPAGHAGVLPGSRSRGPGPGRLFLRPRPAGGRRGAGRVPVRRQRPGSVMTGAASRPGVTNCGARLHLHPRRSLSVRWMRPWPRSCASWPTRPSTMRPAPRRRRRSARPARRPRLDHGAGICHAYTPDGRCVSLLKILLTNFCLFDCAYCVNRRSSNVRRARFTVRGGRRPHARLLPAQLHRGAVSLLRHHPLGGRHDGGAGAGRPDAAPGARLSRLHPPEDDSRGRARLIGRRGSMPTGCRSTRAADRASLERLRRRRTAARSRRAMGADAASASREAEGGAARASRRPASARR